MPRTSTKRTTVRVLPDTGAKRPARSTRDSQQTAVYRAESIAQHLLHGKYWQDTMTELQVLDLMETVINHPGVIARWGEHNVTVTFPTRGAVAWSIRTQNRICLPPGTRTPLTVVHEIAHLLAPAQTEASHGPGFVAIYKYLVKLVLGEEVDRYLGASFDAMGVQTDDTQIPAVRAGHKSATDDIPGLLPGQAGKAAEVLRLAIAAGILGEPGEDTRAAAFTIARRLERLEDTTRKANSQPPARIPTEVTIPVAVLLSADTREDVAEMVLETIRAATVQPQRLTPIVTEKDKRSDAARRAARTRRANAKKRTR